MLTLADKLRNLETELERDAPDATEVLRDISRMIVDLELGRADYSVAEGEIIRTPRH